MDPIEILAFDHLLRIEIRSSAKGIVGIGMFVRSMYFLVPALLILAVSFYALFSGSPLGVLGLVFFALFSFAARNLLSPLFYKEVIELDKNALKLTTYSFMGRKTSVYPVEEINVIKFSGKEHFTKHPLEMETYDALGFGAVEREIQYVISEGVIKIIANGVAHRFAKDLGYWDVIPILEKIHAYSNGKINIEIPESYLEEDKYLTT